MERTIKIKDLPMTSASYEAEQLIYKKLKGKNGRTYLVPIGKFAGDNVHVSGGENSQGYAGRTLAFQLEDGSAINLKDPWHTNSGDLFEQTGYDVRDKHKAKVFIAENCEYIKGEYKPTLSDILHEDLDFQEGFFNRGTDLAKTFADSLNKPVYYYVLTGGGSHSGWKKPGEK